MRMEASQPAIQLVIEEQKQDEMLARLIVYLENESLPSDPRK